MKKLECLSRITCILCVLFFCSCQGNIRTVYGVQGVKDVKIAPFDAACVGGIATNNDPALRDGMLKEIIYNAQNPGIAVFGIGTIQPSRKVVIDTTFEVRVGAGVMSYDVSDMALTVKEGNVVCVYFGKTARPMYGNYLVKATSSKSKQASPVKYLCFNGKDPKGKVSTFASPFGSFLELKWEIE